MSAALLYIISLLPSDIQDYAFAVYAEIVSGLFLVFTDVPYNVADFFATGAMTWTVDVGDLATWRYMLFGKNLKLWLRAVTTTIGGTVAGNVLQLKLPAGMLAAKTVQQVCIITPNALPSEAGIASTTAGSNIVTIFRTSGNFVLGANGTSVNMFLDIEVQ